MHKYTGQLSKVEAKSTTAVVLENVITGSFEECFSKMTTLGRGLLPLPGIICCCLAVLVGSSAMAAESSDLEKEFINPVGSSFSNVVAVSHGGVKTLYISGQVGIGDGQVPELFSEQVDNVFKNIARQLEAAGATLNDVIKITGFIVDIDSDKVAQYGEARSRHFTGPNPPPASSLLGISGLVRDNFLVEVEAVAVIDDN